MLQTGMMLDNRYEIIELIGSGGMSYVYKAKCHKLNRFVAIKVLKPEFSNNKEFISKFNVEAQAVACLSHPNIVSVYDVCSTDDLHYIVMELVQGVTLKDYINTKGKIDIKQSISIMIQVAQGISAAHEKHIIHRDIKPQNIIISKDGKVKVTDFGIARAVSEQTISSNAMGSVHYISPEQARGGYCDERSDIYSLGITLYEMLTGRVPFDGDNTVSVALAHLQSDMVPPSQIEPLIPVSLEKIIYKCTQKKQELRYATVDELIADLRKALLMPKEDFVKIKDPNNGPTVIFSDDDVKAIKEESKKIPSLIDDLTTDPEYIPDTGTQNLKETLHLEPVRNTDDEMLNEDIYVTEEELVEKHQNNLAKQRQSSTEEEKFNKVLWIFGSITGVVIIALCIIIFARGMGLSSFSKPKNNSELESSTASSDTVTMISLLGERQEDAVEKLKSMGLLATITEDYSNEYEEGLIMKQEYEAGVALEKNSSVALIVSKGKDEVEIPNNLVGLSLIDAQNVLSKLDLKYETKQEYSADIASGMVISTVPAAGEKAKKDSVVKIIVSMGEKKEYVEVPSLLKKSKSEAEAQLSALGLELGDTSEVFDNTIPNGYIVSQDKNPGEQVETGTKINVTVSKGSEYATVPKLIGKTLEQARTELSSAGLELGDIQEVYDQTADTDVVISQSIADGTTVGVGEKISITINNKGKTSTNVPDLTECNEHDATVLINANNLVVGNITKNYSNKVAAGFVISQSVAKYTKVPTGTTVDIVISLGPKTSDISSAASTEAGQSAENIQDNNNSSSGSSTASGTEAKTPSIDATTIAPATMRYRESSGN